MKSKRLRYLSNGRSGSNDPSRPMFQGGPDPITLHKMEMILQQARALRNQQAQDSALRNSSLPISGTPTSMQRGYYETAELDPRRNFSHDCGWPARVAPQDYKELVDREPVAGLVNEIYPLESWQVEPDVHEDPDEHVTTDFEGSIKELHINLQREPSYHDGRSGSVISQIMLNLDQLAGFGRYGGLLMGLDDGKDLEEPVTPKKGMKCLFLRPFPEHLCRIVMFDMDWNSPRYGMPIRYLVTFADPQDMSTVGVNENFMARQVHWSRIVHVSDNWHHPTSSPIFAIERLKPLLNAILDIRKIRGSSAEGYYQACFNALHFGTHPQLGPDVEMDRDSIRDMYEEFANGLQRILITTGATVDSIAPTLPDATPAMLIQIQAICMKMRIPFRILMGSEIGQLASGDDKIKWIKRLVARQINFNTPRIVVPVIDRLINVGVLDRPKSRYKVDWPEIDLTTAAERMDALFKRTQAYGFYVTQNVEAVIPPFEYMTKFDSMAPDEATKVMESSQEHLESLQSGDVNLMDEVTGSDDLARPAAGPIGSTPGQYERPNFIDEGTNPRPGTVPLQNEKGKDKTRNSTNSNGSNGKRVKRSGVSDLPPKELFEQDRLQQSASEGTLRQDVDEEDPDYQEVARIFNFKPNPERVLNIDLEVDTQQEYEKRRKQDKDQGKK